MSKLVTSKLGGRECNPTVSMKWIENHEVSSLNPSEAKKREKKILVGDSSYLFTCWIELPSTLGGGR